MNTNAAILPNKSRPSRNHATIEPLELRIAPAALVFANQAESGYNTKNPIATDAAGNLLVAGTFDGIVTLGSGTASVTLVTAEVGGTGQPVGSDLYVAKYTPDGALLWARSWGGVPFGGSTIPQEVAEGIAVDAAGDVFVLASFSSQNAGFGGTGPVSSGAGGFNDTVVLKLNGGSGAAVTSFGNQGMVQWGGNGDDVGGGLAVAGPDLIFTGAYDSANPRLGPATGYPAAVGGKDAYVIRIDGADGSPADGFGVMGMVPISSPLNEGGTQVLVEGTGAFFVSVTAPERTTVVKLTQADGSPVPGFGVGGALDIPNLRAIALSASGDLYATGGVASPGGYVKKFNAGDGAANVDFGSGGTVDLGTGAQVGLSLAFDANDSVYVAGAKAVKPGVQSQYFVAKFGFTGVPDAGFGSNGRLYLANSGNDDRRDIQVDVGPDGHVHLRGFFSGTTDIDPTKGKLDATAAAPGPDAGHPDLDTFLVSFDPNGVDASNPFTFTDNSGDPVRIVFKGTGRLSITPGVTLGVDIERIQVFDTDATSSLSINLPGSALGTTVIAHIITPGAQQHIGIVKLGSSIILGSGLSDPEPALKITGSSTKLLLSDINSNAVIKLGEGLPYSVTGDDTTPDTYNHRPFVKLRDVLGNGVVIDVTGDGTEGGQGGGGLGVVLVNNWIGTGLIKTTQSITAYRQRFGDAFVDFEVDKFGVGVGTRADMGSITITGGSWGSSGTEIEGNCGTFSAASFLAGAAISAGNINKFLIKSGPYAGTVTLKDPSAGELGTFKVNSDFEGYVNSTNSIINVKVQGDFKGSLVAPSIGKIQAFSFDGATTLDLFGDPNRHQIIAAAGSLGSLKTKGGGIANYEIEALTVLGGISVSTGGSGTNSSLTALDNVKIVGTEIGSTTVAIKPATGAGAITLIAMKDVIYDMETTIGKITTSHRIMNSQLSAGTDIDKISVGSGSFPTEGITGTVILAGSNLGGDGLIDGDETWKRSGSIASITAAGAITQSTFSAGVNPVNGIFGDGDDVIGSGGAGSSESIGRITAGLGTGTLTASPSVTHTYVIQGDTLKDLKINGTKVELSGLPKYLQIGGAEAVTDILIRKI